MTWYAAHAIMAFRLKDKASEKRISVWENIILVESDSVDDAQTKAEAYAREQADTGADLTLDDEPCEEVFCGIRKLMTVANIYNKDQPSDGAEISFTSMSVADEAALKRLVEGDSVEVIYENEEPND